MKFIMDWPPSVNHCYIKTARGIVMGKEGKAYKEKVRMENLRSFPIPKGSRVSVQMLCFPPDRRKRDLDNLLKILLDSLNGIAYMDDSDICFLSLERMQIVKNGRIEVLVSEFNNHE